MKINASLKFKFIEENLNKMLMLIVTNQNILRYIHHLYDDPLSSKYPDIEDPMIGTNIILTPFDPAVLTVEEVILFIYPSSGKLRSKPLGTHIYQIDIICPIKKWILNGLGQFRTTRIAYEISKLLDQQFVAGIGETEITDYRVGKVNEDYAILTLWIEVNTATIKGS